MSKPRHSKAKLKKIVTLVKDDYIPQGKYTVQIICIECGKPRMIKPQDKHQVKRCIACQEKKKGAKLKEMISKAKSPENLAEKRRAARLAKLDAWVERNDDTVAMGERIISSIKEKAATEPKMRRIWP